MTATPWMKFYPSDWRADPALRMCCLAARGLWMEMLALMHEGVPRGSLIVNGKPVTSPMLASLTGATVSEVETLTAELEGNGVFSRKKNGVIFSRRIERDENKARKNRDNGKLGGNPTLCNAEKKEASDNPEVKAHGRILEARSQKVEEITSVISSANVAEAFDAYNSLAGRIGLSKATKLSPQRQSKLKARLRDAGGIAGWGAALERVAASAYCRGEVNGFKADLGFLLQDESFTRLMEGKYDDRKSIAHHTGNHKSGSINSSSALVTDALDGGLASIRSQIAEAERREGVGGQDTETLPRLRQVHP